MLIALESPVEDGEEIRILFATQNIYTLGNKLKDIAFERWPGNSDEAEHNRVKFLKGCVFVWADENHAEPVWKYL